MGDKTEKLLSAVARIVSSPGGAMEVEIPIGVIVGFCMPPDARGTALLSFASRLEGLY